MPEAEEISALGMQGLNYNDGEVAAVSGTARSPSSPWTALRMLAPGDLVIFAQFVVC